MIYNVGDYVIDESMDICLIVGFSKKDALIKWMTKKTKEIRPLSAESLRMNSLWYKGILRPAEAHEIVAAKLAGLIIEQQPRARH